MIYVDIVNIYGESGQNIKKNKEILVVACKETGLEVNDDKTKYMVMSPDQNAGRSQKMKIDNSSFEMVEQFKYLGTTITNQNSIQEEIERRLKSGKACSNSMQIFCLPVCYPLTQVENMYSYNCHTTKNLHMPITIKNQHVTLSKY